MVRKLGKSKSGVPHYRTLWLELGVVQVNASAPSYRAEELRAYAHVMRAQHLMDIAGSDVVTVEVEILQARNTSMMPSIGEVQGLVGIDQKHEMHSSYISVANALSAYNVSVNRYQEADPTSDDQMLAAAMVVACSHMLQALYTLHVAVTS